MTTLNALSTVDIKPCYVRSCESDQLSDLAEIYYDDINLCVVNRQTDNLIKTFIDELFRTKLRISSSVQISVDQLDIYNLFPQAKYLKGYAQFCTDVKYLIEIFSELFELSTIGLRLVRLDNTMCPKFHVDHVPCRLVCTYGGQGTQWLEERYLNRAKLGFGAGGMSDEASGLILTDIDVINTMPAYAIGLLKGSKWEGNELTGVVHRSPKPTPSEPQRLLLTLDFA
jgi:hypothetical protein